MIDPKCIFLNQNKDTSPCKIKLEQYIPTACDLYLYICLTLRDLFMCTVQSLSRKDGVKSTMPRKKGRCHSETVEGNEHTAKNKSCTVLTINHAHC